MCQIACIDRCICLTAGDADSYKLHLATPDALSNVFPALSFKLDGCIPDGFDIESTPHPETEMTRRSLRLTRTHKLS